jgi:hypothetical protein
MTTPSLAGVERVRFAREQAPSRAVQRLALDLDGAQVAVRFQHDHVAVDVVDDPAGTLGTAWAKQVERTLDQAVRSAGDASPAQTLPDPQPNRPTAESSRHGAEGGGAGDQPQHHAHERQQQQQQRRWQQAFTLGADEDN